jgi:hypothetical protein
MKTTTLVLAIVALLAGLIAARFWYQSGKIRLPTYKDGVSPADNNMFEWVGSTMLVFQEAGWLNRQAALWTAASVVLSALSAIGGALAN